MGKDPVDGNTIFIGFWNGSELFDLKRSIGYVQEFARRMDALLDLLDVTADAFAAEGDLRKDWFWMEDAESSDDGYIS